MRIKFHYSSGGRLWHGLGINRPPKHTAFFALDLGLIAFDIYKALESAELYFWKFSIEFLFGEGLERNDD